MPRHHCRLITELIAFKQAEGGTIRDLARELGIDETAIIRFRSGARSPSKRVLVKITERYGALKFVRDLVYHHLAAECRDGYVAPEEDVLADVGLPASVSAALRSYIVRFADESMRAGRGLYILAADARLLSAALGAMARAFGADRTRMQVLRGDARLDARTVRAALAAPLVLIERIDFASDGVADILLRRADLTRPCIVTSMQRPEEITGAYLRRIALSTMRLIEIASDAPILHASSSSANVHDAA